MLSVMVESAQHGSPQAFSTLSPPIGTQCLEAVTNHKTGLSHVTDKVRASPGSKYCEH